MSTFSAAGTAWLKEHKFVISDHGDAAMVAGAMTVRIAKTEVAGDNAVLHITLPNGERLVMRAHTRSRR